MKRSDLLWRLGLVPPLGLALYAVASHALLLLGMPLPRALFPGVVAASVVLAWMLRGPEVVAPRDSARNWPRLVAPFAVVTLGFGFCVLVYGSVATGDRSWDGLVSWSLRAAYLAPPADLTVPFFADPGVYSHSREYPLLQPLCLGACQSLVGVLPGRLFFPGLYLAFLLLVANTVRARGLSRGWTWLIVASFGLTPMWFSRGGGSVDSGYAELFLAYFLAVAAAGVLLERPLFLACAAFCLPLVKPEGLPYGVLLCLVTLAGAPGRRLHSAATLSLAGAMLLWLPLQARIVGATPGLGTVLGPLIGVAVLLACKEFLIRVNVERRALWWWGLAAGVLCVVLAIALRAELAVSHTPVLRDFATNLDDIGGRIRSLPRLLGGFLEGLVVVRKFGLIFILLIFLMLAKPAGRAPSTALASFWIGGVALACLAVFLSPGTDLDHEFRSRFDRLLLHWVGVGWLLAGPWAARLLTQGR